MRILTKIKTFFPATLKNFLCLFLLLVSTLHLQAQHPSYWQYTTEDGLPSLTLYDLFIDSKGFLWMGSNCGVSKYVSNGFLPLKAINKRGLSISNLKEDQVGNIWYQNFAGDFFKLQKDTLSKITPSLYNKGNIRTTYFLDDQNNLHISLRNGILVKNAGSDTWQKAGQLSTNKSFLFDFVLLSAQEYIIPDTIKSNGYHIYNTATDQLTKLICDLCNFEDRSVNNIIKLKEEIYIYEQKFQNEEGFIYKLEGQEFKRLNIPGIRAKINNITFDRQNNFWVSTYAGTYGFDQNFQPLLKGFPLFGDKVTTDIVQDHENNYWISTLKSGLFFIPNININKYTPTNSNISDERINCLTNDNNGHLYLGLSNGYINKLNIKSGAVQNLYTNTSIEILDLFFHQNKNLLLAGLADIFIYDQQSTDPITTIAMGSVKEINLFDDSNIIVGTSAGCFAFDIDHPHDHHSLKNFLPAGKSISKKNNTAFFPGRTRSILKDKTNQSIWIAAVSDLINMKEGGIKDTIFFEGENIQVLSLVQTNQGVLWAGTLTHGLIAIKDHKVIQQFNIQNGLDALVIKALTADDEDIWIGSENGLFHFNADKQSILKIDQFDGIPSNEINDITIYEDKVWLATLQGLVSFPKDYIFQNNIAPKVFVTKVAVNNQFIDQGELSNLHHQQNNLRIYLNGVAFKSRGRYNYQYRMNNNDSTFITLSGAANSIHFPALHYGDYEIAIFAENEDGIRSDEPAVLLVSIAPPFWRTWSFLFLSLFILGLIIFLILKRILKNIEKRNEIIHAIRSSRMTALKAQMNPHFLFNSLNSIQDYILSNEKKLANTYLGKFADLMRRILHLSDQDYVSLRDEIESLKLYLELESLRFEDSFEFKLEIDPTLELSDTQIPPMIIQPYVENAIKHGLLHRKQNRKLNLSIQKKSKETIACIIDDNGIGRIASARINQKRKQNHESFASSATESRLKLLNKVHQNKIGIEYIDKEEAGISLGTTVLVNIPIKDNGF